MPHDDVMIAAPDREAVSGGPKPDDKPMSGYETFSFNRDDDSAESRRLSRTLVSAEAVLTADDIIALIGGRAAIVREWLKQTVTPLRHPSGRRVYLWGDVVQAMRRAA